MTSQQRAADRPWSSGALVAVAWCLASIQVLVDLGSRLADIAARPAIGALHLAALVGAVAGVAVLVVAKEPPRDGSRASILRLVVVALASVVVVAGRARAGLAEPTVSWMIPALLVAPSLLSWDMAERWRRGSRLGRRSLRRVAVVWCGVSALGLFGVAVGPRRWAQVDLRAIEGQVLAIGVTGVGLGAVIAAGARSRVRFSGMIVGGLIARWAAQSADGVSEWAMLLAVVVLMVVFAAFVPRVRNRASSLRRWIVVHSTSTRSLLRLVPTGLRRSLGRGARWVARFWVVLLGVARPRVLSSRQPLGRAERIGAAVMALASLAYVGSGWWWARRAGWQPTGHSATVMARSVDVATANHPYVGMITSLGPDRVASHPGPILFDFLSPLVRVFGTQGGAFAGAGLLALISWFAVVWSAWRAGGRWAALLSWVTGAAMVSVAALGVVWDANNVSISTLAMFATLTASWAASTGSWRAWWLAVGLGSLSLQAYLPHGMIAFGPVVWSGLALLGARRAGGDEARQIGRALRGGILVAVVVWVQPMLDMVFNRGGNVADLAGSVADPQPTVGSAGIPRTIGWLFSVPPRWGSITESFAQAGTADELLGGLSFLGLAVASLVGFGWWWTRGRASEPERQLRALVACVVVGAAINIARLPSSFLRSFQLGWLVVASMCVWFAVLFSAGLAARRWLAEWGSASRVRVAQVGVLGVALLGVGLLGASRADRIEDIKGAEFTIDAMVKPLVAQTLASSDVSGPVLVLGLDTNLNQVASDTILSNLIVEGLDVRVPEDIIHYGERRRVEVWDGPQLWVTNGLGPVDPVGTQVAAASAPGWSRAEFDAAASELKRAIGEDPVVLQPWALQALPRYLAGWIGGDSCRLAAELREGSSAVEDLPSDLLLMLYGDAAVLSPPLDPTSQRQASALVGQAPLEVWLVEPGSGSFDAGRLLRDGSSCDPPMPGA